MNRYSTLQEFAALLTANGLPTSKRTLIRQVDAELATAEASGIPVEDRIFRKWGRVWVVHRERYCAFFGIDCGGMEDTAPGGRKDGTDG